MGNITLGTVHGAAEETFVAIETDGSSILHTCLMSEAELRECLSDCPEADIETTIAVARAHPA